MNNYDTSLSKERRRQDGVFYSPEMIAEYILNETLEAYLENVLDKKDALLSVRILDMSCGAGVFLVAGFDILLSKYKILLPSFKNSAKWIVENNLFGVDIDKNAVNICENVLFEKCGVLSKNIKVGNSLITDKNLHEKAFDWAKEFPLPMGEGGFTLIVGNPPYVTVKKDNVLNTLYKWNTDLYLMFFEKCFNDLLKKNEGVLGFITPRFWLVNKINKDFRNFMLTKVNIWQMTETSPFKDANTECIVTLLRNEAPKNDEIVIFEDNNKVMKKVNVIKKTYSLRNGSNEIITFLSEDNIKILNTIEKNTTYLGKIIASKRGMEIGKSDLRIITGKGILSAEKTLIGQDVNRYKIDFEDTYVALNEKDYKRLQPFFSTALIYLRRVANRLIATVSNDLYAYNKNLYGLKIQDKDYNIKYILALLNAKLLDFYYKKKFSLKKIDVFPEIQTYLFEALPIRVISLQEQSIFVQKVDKLLLLNQQLIKAKENWISIVQKITQSEKINKKLDDWYSLNWVNFSNLLPKKTSLSLKQEAEWKDYFNEEKQKTLPIAQEAQLLENEIDALVYALYGLTHEEINMIENA